MLTSLVLGLYGFVTVDVLILEAYGWLRDVVMARHVRDCDLHESWVPRWVNGVAPGVAGSMLTVALWPVLAASDALDWVGSLRGRWAAWRGSEGESE